MNSNVYSIKHFLKKKSLENHFARGRRPFASFLNKGKMAFESFNELNESMNRLEEKYRMLPQSQFHVEKFNDVR